MRVRCLAVAMKPQPMQPAPMIRTSGKSGMGSPAGGVPDEPLGDDGCHGGGEAAATMSAIAGVVCAQST